MGTETSVAESVMDCFGLKGNRQKELTNRRTLIESTSGVVYIPNQDRSLDKGRNTGFI
jgi:hypothetical protein